MRKTLFIAVALVLASLFSTCADHGIQLKFLYKPGQTDRYQFLSEVNTRTATGTSAAAHAVSVDMIMESRVEKVLENGDAELSFGYERISYLNTRNPEMSDSITKQLKNIRITLTVSPYGEIVDVKGYESLPSFYVEDFNIFTVLIKAHPIFPHTGIPIGRKWDRQQEYPIENGLIEGNMLVYKRFVIQDTSRKEGRPVARINSEISMKFDILDNKDFSLSQDGKERLGLFGTGVIHFDTETGRVATASAAVFGKMIVSVRHPVTGGLVKTNLEIAQNLKLKHLP
jgi:hypothetical protein